MKKIRSGWTTQAQLTFVCSRKDGRSLIVALQPEPGMLDCWNILAVESIAASGIQAVLDDHAHLNVGGSWSLSEGMKAAERLAKKWQRMRVSVDACACDDLTVGKAAAE